MLEIANGQTEIFAALTANAKRLVGELNEKVFVKPDCVGVVGGVPRIFHIEGGGGVSGSADDDDIIITGVHCDKKPRVLDVAAILQKGPVDVVL